jgi:hypothetical protein
MRSPHNNSTELICYVSQVKSDYGLLQERIVATAAGCLGAVTGDRAGRRYQQHDGPNGNPARDGLFRKERDPAALRWMRDTGRGRAGRRRWSERRPEGQMPALWACSRDGRRHGVARMRRPCSFLRYDLRAHRHRNDARYFFLAKACVRLGLPGVQSTL